MKACRFVLVLLAVLLGCDYLPPELPERPSIERTELVDQGWSAQAADWFHHASQGTATIPVRYEWFLALEQPEISLRKSPLLSDPAYLSRFGFLSSPKSQYNPDGLPVGFAKDVGFVDPNDGKKINAIGFTCAACHTGQIEYKGTAIRIDGGPAMTDLGKFRKALGLSIAYTYYLPGRFSRFADRVLGERHTDEQYDELKKEFAEKLELGSRLRKVEKGIEDESSIEGFARLDALARIGNFVFGRELQNPKNLVPLVAPVNFPHLWDTSWFDWVQYNSSIRQPMVRNAGEAMGVSAAVRLLGDEADRYKSTVRVDNLYLMEQQLAGPPPVLDGSDGPVFRGLRAPKWPESILGPIDHAKAEKGAELYRKNCQGCHLPPVDTPEFRDPGYWEKSTESPDEHYLKVTTIPIKRIGTDENQARGMAERMVDTGPMGLGTVSYGAALKTAVVNTVGRWYDDRDPPTSAADRQRMNGYREGLVRAEMIYKARPLDGIWATAPYLHNGSVPNLYFMLVPAGERPKTFYLGGREFDPKHVGFEYGKLKGGFKLDTSRRGNSNRGHEFANEKRPGVIGPLLTEDERWSLVEYLKTL